MRQDRKSLSLMDMPDLPVEAFRHVGNRKIKLHGGGNPISDLVEGVGDLVEGVGDAISDVGSGIDDFVNDVIPGGWVTVAAVTLIACGIPDPELLAAAEEGTLTTAQIEAAGYDAMAVAESAATVAPEVVATTEAAMASGISPEVLAMANATADPIAALNAAAGWTASDAGYLMSIGYAGPVVDPVTGISTDVGTAARAQNAGWTSAADSGVEGGVWQDAHGTVFDASGKELAFGDFSADIVSSVPTSVNGVEGVQVTDGMGNTWFEPVGGSPAPVYEAPVIDSTTVVERVPGAQNGVTGHYEVYAGGGSEFVPDAVQATEAVAPEIGYGPAIPEPVVGPVSQVDPAAVQNYLNQGYTQAQIDAAIEANPNGGWGNSLSWGEMGAPGAAVPETVVAENTIPVTLSDGSIGAFDPATGTVYDAAGAVDTAATETMQGAGAGFGEGTQLAEAAKDTAVATDAGLAETPFRVEVSGAAGTAEAPSFVSGPLSEGAQLATNAEVDAGLATWNPAANAWEVTAATIPEAVAPVVPGLTLGQGAALGGGGLVAAGALGGGSSGAVLAGSPAPVTPAPVTPVPAPTLPPVVDATPVPVTPSAPVTPVPAPVTTGPISPETAAVVGGGAVAAGALGGGAAAGAPATVITPTGDIIGVPTTPATTLPPVVDATPVPVTPPAPIAPPPPPTTPGPPVVDAVATPVPPGTETLPGSVASGGLSAADLAKIAAGWVLINGILTPPAVPSPGYGPLNKHYPFGTADKMVNPGLNPGWITAQPFYQTTSPVQSQYYWGNHPYVETPADLANWNNIPYAPTTPWGLQQAQAPFDVNTYIRQTMTPQQQAALAGSAPQYYAPIAPVSPVAGGKV